MRWNKWCNYEIAWTFHPGLGNNISAHRQKHNCAVCQQCADFIRWNQRMSMVFYCLPNGTEFSNCAALNPQTITRNFVNGNALYSNLQPLPRGTKHQQIKCNAECTSGTHLHWHHRFVRHTHCVFGQIFSLLFSCNGVVRPFLQKQVWCGFWIVKLTNENKPKANCGRCVFFLHKVLRSWHVSLILCRSICTLATLLSPQV